MKKNLYFLCVASLALAGLSLGACSNDDASDVATDDGGKLATDTMAVDTITAEMQSVEETTNTVIDGNTGQTRALITDNNQLPIIYKVAYEYQRPSEVFPGDWTYRDSESWKPYVEVRHLSLTEKANYTINNDNWVSQPVLSNLPLDDSKNYKYVYCSGDYNRDGVKDIYALSTKNGLLSLTILNGKSVLNMASVGGSLTDNLLNNVNLGFRPFSDYIGGTSTYAVGDYNRDGYADLYEFCKTSSSRFVWVRILNGRYQYRRCIGLYLIYLGEGDYMFDVYDYENDGYPDLFAVKVERPGGSEPTVTVKTTVFNGRRCFLTAWYLITVINNLDDMDEMMAGIMIPYAYGLQIGNINGKMGYFFMSGINGIYYIAPSDWTCGIVQDRSLEPHPANKLYKYLIK